jgi:hypothetical protein
MQWITKSSIDVEILAHEALDDLVRAAKPGIWTYPAFILIFFFTTDYFQKRPSLLVTFGILNVAISCARALLAHSSCPEKLYSLIGPRLSLLTGASWGLFYGVTIGLFGFESWTFLIVTVCVVGILPPLRRRWRRIYLPLASL